MSAFSGKYEKRAMRAHRAKKKAEAEARNAATPYYRTRRFRRVAAEILGQDGLPYAIGDAFRTDYF